MPGRVGLPEDTRAAIVAAASEAFTTHGYTGVRVQDVARRAGLTTGAIYAHFAGKADLLLEVVATLGAQELRTAGGRPPGTGSGSASAAGLLQGLAARLPGRRPSRPVALEALAAAGRDGTVRRRLTEELAESLIVFRSLIERAKRDGDIDGAIGTDAIAMFGLAMSLGFVALDTLDLPPPAQRDWTDLVTRVMDALAPEGGR